MDGGGGGGGERLEGGELNDRDRRGDRCGLRSLTGRPAFLRWFRPFDVSLCCGKDSGLRSVGTPRTEEEPQMIRDTEGCLAGL